MSESTYLETLKQIEDLKKEAQRQKSQEIGPLIDRFKQAIAVYGIRPEDVFSAEQLGATVVNKPVEAVKTEVKVGSKVQYRNSDGATWTGRGRQPAWFIQAIQQGKTRESMLVGSENAMPASTDAPPKDSNVLDQIPAPIATETTNVAPPSVAMPTQADSLVDHPTTIASGEGAKLMDQQRLDKLNSEQVKIRVTPKGYRLGDRTWTGVGPRPRWIKEAIASGKTLAELQA